ncbi:MAG: hypothetical protein KF729_28655 [Sandaracinaceae bacterium]|nr:hypothetical protein [Sandaracinaceae bacterium]
MPSLFALYVTLATLTAPPPADLSHVFAPVPAVELDVLGDLVKSFDGVPVPIVDPFQVAVMVEVRGTF